MTSASPPPGIFRLWTARVAIALLVLGTTIAVFGLLRGRLGPDHARWMVTAFVGAFFLGSAQASAGAWERRRLAVGLFGQITSLAGFFVFLWGMWFEGYTQIWFWKSEFCLLFVSLSASHTSLLACAKVPPPLVWLRAVSIGCGWFVSGSLVFMILAEYVHPEWLRWLGVMSMLWVSSSFVLGIVHRLDDPESRSE